VHEDRLGIERERRLVDGDEVAGSSDAKKNAVQSCAIDLTAAS